MLQGQHTHTAFLWVASMGRCDALGGFPTPGAMPSAAEIIEVKTCDILLVRMLYHTVAEVHQDG